MLGSSVFQSLLKSMSIELGMLTNHLILCCPLLLCLQSFPASGSFPMSRLFRWLKYWSFSFSISPSNEYSGLISFRVDWFNLLAVLGTLKSLPASQFKNINSLALSLLSGPTFPSIHDYWKTIALTIWTFAGKVSLFFLICYLVLYSFSSKEQASFNITDAIIVHSDFGDQDNKICRKWPPIPKFKSL